MLSLILQRIVATLVVMAVVGVFVFGMLHFSPGDPAAIIAGDLATNEDIERIREKLGLNRPLWEQFVVWSGNVLRGDLGTSIFSDLPVSELIAQRVEPTVALTLTTIVFSVLVAVPVGILAAWKAGSWFDRLVMGFAVFGFSIPVFVFAYVLIWLFAAKLRLLPVMGYVSVFEDPARFASTIVMPTLALGVTYIALIARITRASMLEAINQDYIRTAHAKGLSIGPILFRHALRNASVPIVTTIGIGIALLIGGVVVTESVFAIPGLGRLTVDAILRRDYPVIQGMILIFSGVYVLINLAIDIIYTLLDPRIRYDGPITDANTGNAELNAPAPATGAVAAAALKPGMGERLHHAARFLRRNPIILFGIGLLGAMVVLAVGSPFFATHDPTFLNPINRLKPPSAEHWFGTDHLGRDVYSRVVHGARISLIVGFSVAALSTVLGLAIGLVTGFVRIVDAIVMRVMDGLMAIPSILLAIALISLSRSSVENVIIAITIPEVPRMVRLVRSVVLTLREQLFVDAAVSVGAGLPRILFYHIMPNTVAPLIVQATYVCASAIIIEAILSFLGAGTPPDIPSWGNIMAEGRTYVMIAFWILLFPGIFLTIVVLGVNLLGDGLRDTLDPRLRRSAVNL